MNYEIVIGLETHVELSTKTKIFCSCSTEFGGEPNTHLCPVCLGMPGMLPVLNKSVLEYAIKAGLATNCDITRYSKFDRKNYFYPDLPKAYQISQLYAPICRNGHVDIETEAGPRRVGIHEIHMEEDAGKLTHDPWEDMSLVDYNRGGVPLLEIVTEPDLRSGEETIAYLEKLKATLQYLGVSDCKMQEGSMRADVNISVRPVGSDKLGIRSELKNMNSFKAIGRAIAYEAKRQIEILEEGGQVVQETRRWDENKDATFPMRTKENAHDYRYFPDPDLPPISVSDEQIESLKASLPELPDAKRERYVKEFGLPEYDASILISSKYLADLFEKATDICKKPKEVANMIMGDLMKLLNDNGKLPEDLDMDPAAMAVIINFIAENKINRTTAKKVFEKVFTDRVDPARYIEENQLFMVSDDGAVRKTIEDIFAANPQSVADYKSGKEKARGFLVGQSMRALKGKADPAMVNSIVDELLKK
jgi:aspartyl-tRNA(Asn)/glutamyl-tRNA(Gln) amidotransferase subunit B